MEPTDQELIRDAFDNSDAFEKLMKRHLKAIYTYVYYFTGNMDEANDIAQNTFIKAWKNLKKYDERWSVRTWLLGIARNTAIDWLRKKRPLMFSQFEAEDEYNTIKDLLIDEEPHADELFEKRETEEKIQSALSQLPIRQREIILMHINEELTFEEIGSLLNKPLNTVKSDYRRALVSLKKIMLSAPK